MFSRRLLFVAILINGFWSSNYLRSDSANLRDLDLRNKIESGRQQLEVVLRDKDTDPECWRDTIMELMAEKCSTLNYQSRSLTALKLTLCQLKQRGVDALNEDHCTYEPMQCLEDLYKTNDVAFATFNNLFAQIDNICIYVTMRGHEDRMKESMHSLYTATLESADYLMSTQLQHQEFQQEIIRKHDELRESNEELLDFQQRHQESIERVENMASDIQWRQSDILEQQTQFQLKQEEFHETVIQIDHRQEEVLQNQQRMEHQMESLHHKQSVLNQQIDTSIEVQEKSILNQHQIYDEQQKLHQNIQRNHEQIDAFWTDSSHHQQRILEKQDDALNAMDDIKERTDVLVEETVIVEESMHKLFESQRMEIEAAKQEIEELTTASALASNQIMEVIDEVLFWVQSIYKLDLEMFIKFEFFESLIFYFLWYIAWYFGTIPQEVRSSRWWLFAIFCLSLLIESNVMHRILAFWIPDKLPMDSDYYLQRDYYQWMVRNGLSAVSVLVYFWYYFTFKDRERERLELLRRIDSNVRRAPRVRTSAITFASALSSITPKNMWRRFRK